jgi:hypothetical protein
LEYLLTQSVGSQEIEGLYSPQGTVKELKEKGTSKASSTAGKSQEGDLVSKASSETTERGEQYAEVICYNCGEPGHHKASCLLPKTCFICSSLEHEVDVCPVKKQPQQIAKFIGSAASGLGFYHIELPFQVAPEATPKNIGLIYIDHGE